MREVRTQKIQNENTNKQKVKKTSKDKVKIK